MGIIADTIYKLICCTGLVEIITIIAALDDGW